MPANDATNSPTKRANGHKRASQSRVVPAIPLALSKPRQPKSQPRTDTDTRAEATTTPATPVNGAVSEVGEQGVAAVVSAGTNGIEHASPAAGLELAAESAQNGGSDATREASVSRDGSSMPLSNGQVPDTETISTPPAVPASGQPALVSPSSATRSTDRFDLKSPRAQLPPAFVPFAARQTPESTTFSARPNTLQRTHHPSTNSIVFGGYDSSSSSPIPPQSADSGLNPVQWPPLGSQPPPPTSHGHAHHVSEPYRVQSTGQPSSAPWHMRQGFQQPMYPPLHLQHQGHAQFRYPPREVFTPAEELPPNGFYDRSRSLSQASIAARHPDGELLSPMGDGNDAGKPTSRDAAPAFQPFPPHLRPQYGQFAPPPQQRDPAAAMRINDAEALRSHVCNQFANPLLADCHLQIVEAESGARQYLDAHKIIVSRSSTILDMIDSSKPPESASLKLQVYVSLPASGVRIKPFRECMQYLYGGVLSQLEQLHRVSYDNEAFAGNEERMQSALEYVATAAWLRLPSVAAQAMGAVLGMLHWDTMAAVLGFALEGGLGASFAVEDGSDMSCASSDDSLGRADGIGMPTHDPYATDLLHRVIDFTVHMFPPNFYLDAAAPQLSACPRLPPLPPAHESRPSRSDPRLSQIRFGELAVEDHGRPSQITTKISSLLLSLPFSLLKCVLEHNGMVFQLGPDTVASIMRQVVAEREVRRKKVLQARTVGQTEDGAALQLIQNLFFEERVEPSAQHRAGFRLARTKRGIDTPPSSGAASERI